MKLLSPITALLALSQGLALAKPIENEATLAPRQDRRGSYTYRGLGARKQQILGVGGNSLDLAIAMLETYALFLLSVKIGAY
jgi:hypothetical protein